jgi:hypothetical protein
VEVESRRRAEEENADRQAAEAARLKAEAAADRLAEEEARLKAVTEPAPSAWETAPGLEAEAVAERATLGEALPSVDVPWMDFIVDRNDRIEFLPPVDEPQMQAAIELEAEALPVEGIEVVHAEKGIAQGTDDSKSVPALILKRLESDESSERAAALNDLARMGGDDSFRLITKSFDDSSAEVCNAAARALHDLQSDRAASFTRALREGSHERRRKIGAALAGSGLATEAIDNLTGESREWTYDAFSLLFLMAKAGEVQPLMQAIEDHTNIEVRLAVVKLLALSGQPEVVPAFRRLALRGSLPSEVRSAVMEAIYQISSQARESAPSAA